MALNQWWNINVKAKSVEDLGIPPYWLGSIMLRKAGPTWVKTINSSASLVMAGVREIGRRCFEGSFTGFCLGRRTTSASFHEGGSFCSLKLQFKMEECGCSRISAYSRRSQLGTQSGPAALRGLSFWRALRTADSETTKEDWTSVGRNALSRGLKHSMGLRKAALMKFASSGLQDFFSKPSSCKLDNKRLEPETGINPEMRLITDHHWLGFVSLRLFTLDA